MKIWKIVVPLVIIVAAIYAVPRIGKSTVIEQDGDQLSITIGKHRLTAAVISSQITDWTKRLRRITTLRCFA